jgi:hypothetical protein
MPRLLLLNLPSRARTREARRRGLALVLFALPIFVVGCIAYRAPVTVLNPDRANDVHFPGFLSSLRTAPVVNVLVVHGMGTHDGTYANVLIAELQRQSALHVKSPCTVVDRLANAYGAYSIVERCTLADDNDHELRLYVLVWSPLTEQFENLILAYDWKLYGSQRALVDRQLKQSLIDTSFDDAIIYSGSFAPAMRASVQRALCVLMTDKTRADLPCSPEALVLWNSDRTRRHVRTDIPPVFLVSHSLGSIMVTETLAQLSARSTEPESEESIEPSEPVSYEALEAKLFLRHAQAAFLLANQLPLIFLARIPPEPLVTRPAIFPPQDAFAGRIEPLPLVAFNDINDLLTFPLPAGWAERLLPGHADLLRVINVRVTNAPYRWAGIVVNPGRAHNTYWTNESVVKLMLMGN